VSELVTALLLTIGAAFMLLAAVGVVRMPDLMMRLSATSKAVTLGVGCLLLAVAIAFGTPGAILRALAIIAFFLITVPIGAHMIGRAAYGAGVPLWEGTIVDELRGRDVLNTHAPDSQSRGAAAPGSAITPSPRSDEDTP
jgi:multicomponent Na+:H+ antiporter subunit G